MKVFIALVSFVLWNLVLSVFVLPSTALADNSGSTRTAVAEKDFSERIFVFTSPVANFASRPNLGVRFPVASLQWPIPLEISAGLKATYYPSGYQTESTLGCESCSAPSWRSRGFEVGPQLYLSTKGLEYGWLQSFDLRMSAYFTQSLGQPTNDDNDGESPNGTFPSYTSQDTIKGVSFEAMGFANFALGNLFFANTGAGLIFEPHHLTNTGTLDGIPAQESEYETAVVVEINLGLAFP
jgi:hypothetical protein